MACYEWISCKKYRHGEGVYASSTDHSTPRPLVSLLLRRIQTARPICVLKPLSCFNRQNIGQVLDSKANLTSYCHEVQKKLGMQYRTPPLPVDLRNANAVDFAMESFSQDGQNSRNNEIDEDAQFQQFRLMAQNKYNIRLS